MVKLNSSTTLTTALVASLAIGGCETVPTPQQPQPQPVTALTSEISMLRTQLRERDRQVEGLSLDIARLKKVVCLMEVKYGRIYIERDPASRRNRVLVTNAEPTDSRICDR